MKFYLAPLEGLTTYVYRNVYHHFFHPMDKYFTPFIVPHPNRGFKPKELKEILPQHNQGLCVVPQILTNNAEDFIRTAQEFREYGYEEINLNLGCPSGTVTAKKKGSGFLGYPDELERFLYEIFERTESKISIKTRIGGEHPGEFERLLNIYNKFEMEELIIHPRVRADFYKNKPNMEVFGQAVKESKNRLCYNGDLFIKSHFEAFEKEYPQVERVMLGRGVMVNPGLLNLICEGKSLDKEVLRAFHDEFYRKNQEVLSGDRAVLFKMKELWFFMIHLFEGAEKAAKKIKKAEKRHVYEECIERLFSDYPLNQKLVK